MSILVGLHHVTTYRYDRPVSLGPQVIRLRPAPHCRTPIRSYSLKVLPAEHFVNWQQDPHGNWLARYVFPEKTTEFAIAVDFVADMQVINPFDFFVEPYAEQFPVRLSRSRCAPILRRIPRAEPAGPLLAGISRRAAAQARRTPSITWSLSTSTSSNASATSPAWSPACRRPTRRLQLGSGSCRDTAWLLVQILRHLGLAARFVSGYLIQLKPDVKSLDGPAGADAGLHRPACLGRSLPAGRRLGRPRSDLGPVVRRRPSSARRDAALSHRPRRSPAWSKPPKSISPSRCRSSRIAEKPRVTYPFSDDAWAALDALGERSMPISSPRTCASPWAASRPSCRSTITSRPNGTPTRSARPSASAPTT